MLLALLRAFVSLAHPRMLWMMIWPVLAALALWVLLAALFWGEAVQWVDIELGSNSVIQWMLTFAPLAFMAAHLAWIILAIAFIPLVLVTAVVLVGVFAMPAMVEHVSSTAYPTLSRRHGGTTMGSLWNTAIAVAVFTVLAVVTLPLWAIPLLWPVLPVLMFAYLNQRVFRYDALAEHASVGEMAELFRRYRRKLFGLGVVVAIMGHVPLVGFLVPVYGGLAFAHYGLERLQALRDEPIEGRIVEP